MDIGAAIAWVEDHIDHGGWAARSARLGTEEMSLDRMRALMGLLSDPQCQLDVVHVTGTNGKGSTSAMITRLLMAEGLVAGTYSSPHVSTYNERFRIDAVEISDAELADMLTCVADAEAHLGERGVPFELLTASALTWLARRRVDVAVIEVGVLGRFDATNVADGGVAVVTNIGFDHTSGAGDWQHRIAAEKAGIVKPGAHLILGPIEQRLEPVFTAQEPSAVWRFGHDISIADDQRTRRGRRISVVTPLQRFTGIELPLHGAHQSTNAALALAAASAHLRRPLDADLAADALGAVMMPGRLELIATGPCGDGPIVILDGAHNPEAAVALSTALRDDLPPRGRRTLVVGLLVGRDPRAMLQALDVRSFDRVVVCTPPTARARPAEQVAAAAATIGCDVEVVPEVGDALTAVLAAATAIDDIVVTGSIYLVGRAREWLGRES